MPPIDDRPHRAELIDLEKVRKANATKQQQTSRDLARIVASFNKKYAVVNDGGELRVFSEKLDPQRHGHWKLDRFTFADFSRMHMNRRLTLEVERRPGQIKVITESVANLWLRDPRRREYLSGIIFDPTQSGHGRGYWNLWKGFAIKPRRGNWKLLQAHIFRVLCAGSRENYEFLINTTARMLQHPELPAEVCVVLQGEEGSGKGIFARALAVIMGQHGLHISHPEHLRGKHNAHLQDCVFLFADEAFYAGDKQHESILKALITEESLAIEPKNKRLFETPNYLHIYMSSNLNWVVPASLRARRWFVLRVSDHRVGDSEYFAALHHEIKHGGSAAMLFDLLNRDLTKFDPRKILVTDALADQKLHSLDTLHRWWMAVLERGFVWCSRYGVALFNEWPAFCTTELLNRSYLQWCEEMRLYRQSRVDLGKMMAELYSPMRPRRVSPVFEVESLPIMGPRSRSTPSSNEPALPIGALPSAEIIEDADPLEKAAVVKKPNQPGYQLGTLEEARARFAEMTKLPMPW